MKVVIAGEMPYVETIGQLCMQAGHDTILYLVEDFYSAVQSGWAMPDAAGVDVAVELYNESAEAKEELLAALGGFIPRDALLLTSALATSATQAAAWVPNPARAAGFSYFPSPQGTDVVEITAALQTAVATMQRAADFWRGVNMEPVIVQDGPGLVRARIVCCLINEAVSALMEGTAVAADIDQAMVLGTNYPAGLLAWADHVGLDTVLGVMNGLFTEWGEDRYRPSPLLKRMVMAGKLGKKSGAGFFNYEL